jgi:hypothetical protein
MHVMQSVSSVFISAAEVEEPAVFALDPPLFQTKGTGVQQNFSASPIGSSSFP